MTTVKASLFDKIRFKLSCILDRLAFMIYPYQKDRKDVEETCNIIDAWYGVKSNDN
ncbi:hypothetical protein HOG48_02405 [Candidatus Peregrinibacteria bacterium]|jgi:hypothetical protein|nr:hypothetical protein [Candidatus Peregrinibacteria bacterium]